LNTTRILQERIRSAFAPAVEPALEAPDPSELAKSSEACHGLDLAQRIATIRNVAFGRIVFTTSFGIEDQAITHAICSQALAIDVVTLDTGRLFPQTYELWARTERRYGRRIQAFYPDCRAAEALVDRQGHQRILYFRRGPPRLLRGSQG
jgi:3'-phosphoadenosine 5'-phosphosulfate sulfotransferase (PAPS reductase)/FAD synthetase